MTVSGTSQRRRHGLAGLLVALFVVAGLVFSYGLGHAPPARVCTEHAVTVPVDVALTGHDLPAATGVPVMDAPVKRLPHGPAEFCLCLAVLFGLLTLGLLAAGLGRARLRLPARTGWSPALPRGGVPVFSPSASLQVLRL